MKKLLFLILVLFVLTGCGNDDKSAKENEETSRAIIEDVKAPPLTKKDPVEGIEVSKKEVDKLIPLAKQLRLDEKKVTFTAKMLKKVGVDFNLIHDDGGDFKQLGMYQSDDRIKCQGKDRTSILTVMTGNNNKYVSSDSRIQIRIGANEHGDDPSEAIELGVLYEVGRDAALNPKYYLYDLMKEGASIKPFFITREDADKLKSIAMKYVEGQGEKVDQTMIKQAVIPKGDLKDDGKGGAIPYYSVPVLVTRVSKVYGEGEKKETVYVHIDVSGNVIEAKGLKK